MRSLPSCISDGSDGEDTAFAEFLARDYRNQQPAIRPEDRAYPVFLKWQPEPGYQEARLWSKVRKPALFGPTCALILVCARKCRGTIRSTWRGPIAMCHRGWTGRSGWALPGCQYVPASCCFWSARIVNGRVDGEVVARAGRYATWRTCVGGPRDSTNVAHVQIRKLIER